MEEQTIERAGNTLQKSNPVKQNKQDEANDFYRKFANDVREGLGSQPKSLPSLYFYDKKGSELFQEITALPEYYLSRAEHEILENESVKIVEQALQTLNPDQPVRFIELGAGDTSKLFPLIEAFLDENIDIRYTAIDISPTALEALAERVADQFHIPFQGVVAEYNEGLQSLANGKESDCEVQNFVFFLGSNIGNFAKSENLKFLRTIRRHLNPGDCLLIGMDKKKDIDLLMDAYKDASNITSEFNLNLLTRMNRELNADFNLENFSHHALYNPVSGDMESYLISECAQDVHFGTLNETISFKAYEPIFTERSHKYDEHDIDELAGQSGFVPLANFTDKSEYFIDTLWTIHS